MPQLAVDTRALEVAVRADARVSGVEQAVVRIDGNVAAMRNENTAMRAENTAQHTANATKLDAGLARVHDRIDESNKTSADAIGKVGDAMNKILVGVAAAVLMLLVSWLWDLVRPSLVPEPPPSRSSAAIPARPPVVVGGTSDDTL